MEEKNIYKNMDEVDLKEILITLKKRKYLSVAITGFTMLIAVLYISFSEPIYESQVILEIGQAMPDNKKNNIILSNVLPLEKPTKLKVIVELKTESQVHIIKGTKLLKIITNGPTKKSVLKKTKNTIKFILNRHQEIAKFYSDNSMKVQMTKLIQEIQVSDKPVSPKKILVMVLAFFIGIMLSVLSILLLELFKNLKDS